MTSTQGVQAAVTVKNVETNTKSIVQKDMGSTTERAWHPRVGTGVKPNEGFVGSKVYDMRVRYHERSRKVRSEKVRLSDV